MAETYRISKTRLKGIADQARRLGEIQGTLTPKQIQQTLEGVTGGDYMQQHVITQAGEAAAFTQVKHLE